VNDDLVRAADRLRSYLCYLKEAAPELSSPLESSAPLERAVTVNPSTWKPWFGAKPPSRATPRSALPPNVQCAAENLLGAIPSLHPNGARSQGIVNRQLLADLATAVAAYPDDRCLVTQLWIATMMWGSGTSNGRGPWRTYQSLASESTPGVLAEAFDSVRTAARTDAAHEAFAAVWSRFDIPGVGSAFFTKWMWVASLGDPEVRHRPLILDARVAQTLRCLVGPTDLRRAERYVRYLEIVERLVAELRVLGLDAEKLEFLLFWRPERGQDDHSLLGFLNCSPR